MAVAEDDRHEYGVSGDEAPKHARNAFGDYKSVAYAQHPKGRFPANVIHDGSEEVLAGFPETGKSTGGSGSASVGSDTPLYSGYASRQNASLGGFGDSGSAARFFYCAKASKAERGEGNDHPTVKPLALMSYLCALTKTPTGGIILDPFMGSGTLLRAAKDRNRKAIGIDTDEQWCEIAAQRMAQEVLPL